MSREIIKKELLNTRLSKNYGGWFYCEKCEKSIGYLCFVTYDKVDFKYSCACGGSGVIKIELANCENVTACTESLITINNRLCCPNDNSPLITILEKNLKSYSYSIVCNECSTEYKKEVVL